MAGVFSKQAGPFTKELPYGTVISYHGERGPNVPCIVVSWGRFDDLIGRDLHARLDSAGGLDGTDSVECRLWETLAAQWRGILTLLSTVYLEGVDIDTPEYKRAVENIVADFRRQVVHACGHLEKAKAARRENREDWRAGGF